MHDVRNIRIIRQIAIVVGSRIQKRLLANGLQFCQHEWQIRRRVNLSLLHFLFLSGFHRNIGFERVGTAAQIGGQFLGVLVKSHLGRQYRFADLQVETFPLFVGQFARQAGGAQHAVDSVDRIKQA